MQVSQTEVKNFFESTCGGEVGMALEHGYFFIRLEKSKYDVKSYMIVDMVF